MVSIPLESGQWISESVNRTIELIREYDPNLDVQWIPPNQRAEGEPAFLIVEKVGGRFVPVFSVDSEEYMDERILERIILNDHTKRGDILSEMDARNQAKRAILLKEKKDEMEEAHDLAHHILKSPKTRYKHDGVTYE